MLPESTTASLQEVVTAALLRAQLVPERGASGSTIPPPLRPTRGAFCALPSCPGRCRNRRSPVRVAPARTAVAAQTGGL